ncbi:hypothetical protein FCULG_00005801 [Fusarium culmorum]|uniref:Uncharacterized protein n=1 Tax=Fusarium culmorum TaxID=5516 RepID=A0A2T4GWX2_FUSCU|nr:hypothetical protein FCULG_00005801 [Fusarium culmorum]
MECGHKSKTYHTFQSEVQATSAHKTAEACPA